MRAIWLQCWQRAIRSLFFLFYRSLTCKENSYKEGNSCATAPTASSAMFIQSARDNEMIRGVRHDHKPASVTSLHPANSSSYRHCNQILNQHKKEIRREKHNHKKCLESLQKINRDTMNNCTEIQVQRWKLATEIYAS